MYQTLTDLYNGKIQPFSINPENDGDFRLAYKDYCRSFNELSKLVGKQHDELMNELANAVMQLTAVHERILFCDGFRLGMRLAAECFFSYGKQDGDDLV